MAMSFCREVLGIKLAVGEVSRIEQTLTQAVAPAVEEAAGYGQSGDLNIDETPWKERRQRRVLWTMVTTQLSVFAITAGRATTVLRELVGEW